MLRVIVAFLSCDCSLEPGACSLGLFVLIQFGLLAFVVLKVCCPL